MKDMFFSGMTGLVVGDALGVPVEFMDAEEIASRPNGPVTGMEGYGSHRQKAGTWSDDSSMALGTLESMLRMGTVDSDDIMQAFSDWASHGDYSPDGIVFDIGNTCSHAISRFNRGIPAERCGVTGEHANGNGALMRILPVCLYADAMVTAGKYTEEQAIALIHKIGGLTHNHLRTNTACGIYYFIIRAMKDLKGTGTIRDAVRKGYERACIFYHAHDMGEELHCYEELADPDALAEKPAREVMTGGYVVETLNAAAWGLVTTESYRDALLKVVNRGHDSDTTADVTGGLAGIWYGFEGIPAEWRSATRCLDRITDDAKAADRLFYGEE